jgi:hypothetical protein
VKLIADSLYNAKERKRRNMELCGILEKLYREGMTVKALDESGKPLLRNGDPNDEIGRLIRHFLVHFLDFRASGSVWTGYAFG